MLPHAANRFGCASLHSRPTTPVSMKIIRTGVVCKKLVYNEHIILYDINSAWTNVSFKLFGNSVTIFKAILFDFIIWYKNLTFRWLCIVKSSYNKTN